MQTLLQIHLHSRLNTWLSMDWAKTTARRDEKHFSFGIWCDLYEKLDGNYGPLYDYHYEKSWVTFVEILSNAVCIILLDFIKTLFMMTSSNGNTFLAAALCEGNPTVIGHRLIRLTKASDAELWWFVWSTPDQTFEHLIEAPVMWDAIPRIMTSW